MLRINLKPHLTVSQFFSLTPVCLVSTNGTVFGTLFGWVIDTLPLILGSTQNLMATGLSSLSFFDFMKTALPQKLKWTASNGLAAFKSFTT